MRKYIPITALFTACLFLFTACGEKKEPVSSVEQPASSSVSEPVHKPDPTPEKPPESAALSVSDSRRLLAEDIDTDSYMILDGNTKLEVGGESYYVFIVADRSDNKVVGQLAVNKKTGEKFNYEGQGVLSAYSEFSLYNAEVEADYNWEGTYTDGERTVELLPMDDSSFEYTIGDVTGAAQINVGKARDAENDITFSWDEGGNLVLIGAVVGTFAPAE